MWVSSPTGTTRQTEEVDGDNNEEHDDQRDDLDD